MRGSLRLHTALSGRNDLLPAQDKLSERTLLEYFGRHVDTPEIDLRLVRAVEIAASTTPQTALSGNVTKQNHIGRLMSRVVDLQTRNTRGDKSRDGAGHGRSYPPTEGMCQGNLAAGRTRQLNRLGRAERRGRQVRRPGLPDPARERIAHTAGVTELPTGASGTADGPLDRLVSVNIGGVVNGCRSAIRQFQQQGGGGVIVNTASVAGLIGWGSVVYGATKGAITTLTRALALEMAPLGIRVNSVCPGGMMTKFGIGARGPIPETVQEYTAKLHPLGRVIDPMDCANGALFLASDLASNITGVNLPVDGGLSAGK